MRLPLVFAGVGDPWDGVRFQTLDANQAADQKAVFSGVLSMKLRARLDLLDVLLEDLTEMESVDGKRDGQREEAWPCEQRPEKEFPVVESFLADHAEDDRRFDERFDISDVDSEYARLCRSVVFQEVLDALIVLPR